LIVRLGDWVLPEATRAFAEWRKLHPAKQMTIAVNVSARQLVGTELVTSVRSALAATNLPAECLVLEVTETAVMYDVDQTAAILDDLRALGVSLALDDFGTGYASISYLNRFPISVLKIDRSFVTELLNGGKESELTRTIVRMAHAMDLKVVAEGIETEQQLAALRKMECEEGQGFLMALPLSASSVEDLLARQLEEAA
jgi:EAL domain-containing protein (putative c-di-GMP-specific phosphodiesterase class I)